MSEGVERRETFRWSQDASTGWEEEYDSVGFMCQRFARGEFSEESGGN